MASKGELLLEKFSSEPAVSDPAGPSKGERLLEFFQTIPSDQVQMNSVAQLPKPPAGVERHAREGVPLDVSTGMQGGLLGVGNRAGLSMQPTDKDKLAYLRGTYAGAQVEPIEGGNFIIRNVMDQSTGQAKDLLLDEQGTSLGDIADLANAVPEVAAELLVFKGLGMAKRTANMGRVARLLTESGVAAGASQTEAALSDAMTRLLGDRPVEVREIAGRRAGDTVSNFVLGTALGGAVESVAGAADTARGRLTGMLAPGPAEKEGIQALSELQDARAINIQPTLGQMAANEDVLQLESFMSRIPLFGRAFKEMYDRQNAALRDAQRKIVGDVPVAPYSEVGAEIAQTIVPLARQPAEAAKMLETRMVDRAVDEIEEKVLRMAPNVGPLTPEIAGDMTKLAARARHNEFRDRSNELFAEAGNPSIPLTGLDARLKEIEAKLPTAKVEIDPNATLEDLAADVESEVKAFLVDAAGKPIVSEQGQAINRQLVGPALTKLLSGLRKLPDEVPLDQLRTVRNTIDNAIREGRGLEGIDTYQLKQVSHALTETIEEGVEQMADQPAAAALKRANAFYKENIETFEVPFVAQLLKSEASQPGYIESIDLIDRITASKGTFRQVEKFLKSSMTEGGKPISRTSEKAFNFLRRGILEDMFRRASTHPGVGRYINVDQFVSDLGRFSPELQASLLGADQRVIEKNVELLKQVKTGFKDVPADDLRSFLRSGYNTVEDLSKLATARKQERIMLENEVIGKLLKQADDQPLLDFLSQPERFDQVTDWMMKAKNDADVSTVMAMLNDNPAVINKLRANTVADLFQKVAQKARADEAVARDATRQINATKLTEQLRDPETANRLRLILGVDTFNVLDNFGKSMALFGKTAGQTLVGSNTRVQILRNVSKFLTNLPDTMAFIVYSQLFTNRTLQRMIQEGAMLPATDVNGLTRALVQSPPVIEALADEFGQGGLEFALEAMQQAISLMEPSPIMPGSPVEALAPGQSE